MKRVAIVVASQYGQTAKIGKALQSTFEAAGMLADVVQPDKRLEDYDGVIIGSPVYIGKFNSEIVAWTKENLPKLNRMRTAFFSVSLNAADKSPLAKSANDQLLRDFLNQTGLKAEYVAAIAGTLHYTKYGWLKRWLLKRISASHGGPTDTSRDHDLTDWAQVAALANAYLQGNSGSPFSTSVALSTPAVLGKPQVLGNS